MSVLHTVNKSPFQTGSLASCLRLARKGSVVLLIEDAVYGAAEGTSASTQLSEALKDKKVYALGPDLEARGLSQERVIRGIKVVDYGGFVDLVAEHDHVQAWL